jgi:DNA-binding NarL/FixJ family response regulator
MKKPARIITEREAEVVRLLKLGLRFKAIAHELGISESTARTHAQIARRKLEAVGLGEIVGI